MSLNSRAVTIMNHLPGFVAASVRSHTVAARMQTLGAGVTSSCPCLDPSQRYMFRPNGHENLLLVYDMQSDSLAATYQTLPYPVFAAANPQLGRIYVGCPDAVLVFSDTVVSGVCEAPRPASFRWLQTVARGILFLPEATSHEPQASSLLDAAGRKVLQLHCGGNDVRALAPGVYFVREEPQALSPKPQAVRKVVITR